MVYWQIHGFRWCDWWLDWWLMDVWWITSEHSAQGKSKRSFFPFRVHDFFDIFFVSFFQPEDKWWHPEYRRSRWGQCGHPRSKWTGKIPSKPMIGGWFGCHFLYYSHRVWVSSHPKWRSHIFQRSGPGPPTRNDWFSSKPCLPDGHLKKAYSWLVVWKIFIWWVIPSDSYFSEGLTPLTMVILQVIRSFSRDPDRRHGGEGRAEAVPQQDQGGAEAPLQGRERVVKGCFHWVGSKEGRVLNTDLVHFDCRYCRMLWGPQWLWKCLECLGHVGAPFDEHILGQKTSIIVPHLSRLPAAPAAPRVSGPSACRCCACGTTPRPWMTQRTWWRPWWRASGRPAPGMRMQPVAMRGEGKRRSPAKATWMSCFYVSGANVHGCNIRKVPIWHVALRVKINDFPTWGYFMVIGPCRGELIGLDWYRFWFHFSVSARIQFHPCLVILLGSSLHLLSLWGTVWWGENWPHLTKKNWLNRQHPALEWHLWDHPTFGETPRKTHKRRPFSTFSQHFRWRALQPGGSRAGGAVLSGFGRLLGLCQTAPQGLPWRELAGLGPKNGWPYFLGHLKMVNQPQIWLELSWFLL